MDKDEMKNNYVIIGNKAMNTVFTVRKVQEHLIPNKRDIRAGPTS